ncbi:MAG TPA: polysaccharide deacetylase family protein [Puia sp.]|nr:polysaccharide deacetylase family protein [Puia sp.]
MLNFRNTNILFGALTILLIGLHIFHGGISFFVYPVLLFIYSWVLFYGCAYVGSNFFLPVICAAKTDKKEIALSFDDGPAADYTGEILAILREEKVPAAFFCIGSRIAGNEKILRQLQEEGHVIGNHSYSHHFWFDLFSSKKMLDDLKMMDSVLSAVTGLQPRLFRPPYGVINPNLKRAILRGGYTPIGWNVRSLDTVIKNEQKLLKKIDAAIKPGAILLFHDTSRTTLAILPGFIRQVKERGYEIVRLDKMLNLQAYA